MTTPRLRPKYSTKNIIHIEDSDEELEWFSSDTQTHFEDRHRNNLRSGEPLFCQLCGQDLTNESIPSRQEHYDGHPDVTPTTSKVMHPEAMDQNTDSVTPKKPIGNEKGAFWHISQDCSPPRNFTPGLVTLIKKALLKSHSKGYTTRAVLCYEGAVHVSVQMFDRGWGCGYRNFLMACTGLYDQQVCPEYIPALNSPTPPGVRNLQHWLENAWDDGFDKDGANQLKNKLVGTSKWLGTADLYVAFTSRGIPAQLVDFPEVGKGAEVVIRWIESYFSSRSTTPLKLSGSKTASTSILDSKVNKLSPGRSTGPSLTEVLRGASPVVTTEHLPIILQHDGHSRMVIGFEKCKNGNTNLLIFDPSFAVRGSLRDAALSTVTSLRHSSPLKISIKERTSKYFKKVVYSNNGGHGSPTHHRSPEKKPRLTVDLTNSDPEDIRNRGEGRSRTDAIVLSDEEEEEIDAVSDDVRMSDGDDEIEEVQQPGKRKLGEKLKAIAGSESSRWLRHFKLSPHELGKKAQYQILYFPLGELLSERERCARRFVTADVVR